MGSHEVQHPLFSSRAHGIFYERTEVLLQLLTPYRRYYEWHLNYFGEVISSHVSRRATVTSLNRFSDNSSVYSDDKHTRSFVQK
mgnify:CR=1 FL=1